MLSSLITVLALLSASASSIVVHPGGIKNVTVTTDNTVNSTSTSKSPTSLVASTGSFMSITVQNNLDSNNVKCYFTGRDPVTGQAVMLPAGWTSWYYPNTDSYSPVPITQDTAIPLGPPGSTMTFQLPGYLSSARIYFADGDLGFYILNIGGGQQSIVQPSAVNPYDPSAGVNWGFVEFDYSSNAIYADISYVDFVGLPLGMSLRGIRGTQDVTGLVANAVSNMCNSLKAQSTIDGAAWEDMCFSDSNGNALRVLSPMDFLSGNLGNLNNYWTTYIDAVWSYYTNNVLTLLTAEGLIPCQVQNGNLTCSQDDRSFPKPSASDLFGCNGGPFGIIGGDSDVHVQAVPILCAAFHRSTLLLPGGNIQPSLTHDHFYTIDPTDYYSKFVHENEVSGTGYAFAYDDVTAASDINASGTIVDENPTLLLITVGGPSSDAASAPPPPVSVFSTSSTSSTSTTSLTTSATSSSTTTLSTTSTTFATSTTSTTTFTPFPATTAPPTSSSSAFYPSAISTCSRPHHKKKYCG